MERIALHSLGFLTLLDNPLIHIMCNTQRVCNIAQRVLHDVDLFCAMCITRKSR